MTHDMYVVYCRWLDELAKEYKLPSRKPLDDLTEIVKREVKRSEGETDVSYYLRLAVNVKLSYQREHR